MVSDDKGIFTAFGNIINMGLNEHFCTFVERAVLLMVAGDDV